MRADTLTDAAGDAPPTRRRNILGQVREVLRSNRRGHSRLFLWMRAHHDDLAAEFTANTPNWQQLAQIFRDEGLTDQTGKAPSPAIARLTWYRVRQAVARNAAEGGQQTRPEAADDDGRASGKSSSALPVAPMLLPLQRQAPAADASVDERFRAFRADLNTGKVRIPEPINPAKPKGKRDGET